MWREAHGRVLQNLDNRGVLQKTPLGEGAGMFRSSETSNNLEKQFFELASFLDKTQPQFKQRRTFPAKN